MAQPKNKAELLAWLREEQAYWEALLAQVPAEAMVSPGAMGEWTFKDVVAHLTGWRKLSIARLLEPAQGAQHLPPEWPAGLGDDDAEATNAWIYRTNRDRPPAEVLAESRQTWEQLAAAVEARPEADLLEPGRFPWLGGEALAPAVLGGAFAHLHEEHESDIRAWLARFS